MTAKNSKNSTNGSKMNAELFAPKINFVPLFNKGLSIKYDGETPIQGTALMIFQGAMNSILEWDHGKGLEVAQVQKFVFSVRSTSGTWQACDITSGNWGRGNLYDRLLKALGATDYVTLQIDKELPKAYQEVEEFDFDKAIAGTEPMRGILFTAEMIRITKEPTQYKKGGKFYEIQVDSLIPLKNDDGTLSRRQKIEETNPQQPVVNSQNNLE